MPLNNAADREPFEWLDSATTIDFNFGPARLSDNDIADLKAAEEFLATIPEPQLWSTAECMWQALADMGR